MFEKLKDIGNSELFSRAQHLVPVGVLVFIALLTGEEQKARINQDSPTDSQKQTFAKKLASPEIILDASRVNWSEDKKTEFQTILNTLVSTPIFRSSMMPKDYSITTIVVPNIEQEGYDYIKKSFSKEALNTFRTDAFRGEMQGYTIISAGGEKKIVILVEPHDVKGIATHELSRVILFFRDGRSRASQKEVEKTAFIMGAELNNHN